MPASPFHDQAYKEVFSHPRILRSFLTDILKEPWVSLIDFATLRLTSPDFAQMGGQRREADLLVELGLRDRRRLLLYLLLEFQSSVQAMGLRLLEYMLRAYQQQGRAPQGTLPVVVPVVIYNGEREWAQPARLIDSFPLAHRSLRAFVPDFRYLLVDVKRLEEERLRKLGSEVACFFLLDKTEFSDAQAAAQRIVGLFRELIGGLPADVRKLFQRYVAALVGHKGDGEIPDDDALGSLLYSEGGGGMLAQSLERLIEKGRQEGRVEERREAARRMLRRGFSHAEIAEITGLPEDDVQALASEP